MIKLDLDKKKRYLLACSYGPDSMALFSLLLKNNYDFEVAHVNYGLRSEADFESEQLRKYCDENKIKFHFLKVEETIDRNIEEKCREIRYKFFKKIIQENRLNFLLVAHNGDDLIETYFLQKYRHNIVEHFGLEKSSKMDGYEIIRPLLGYSKEELATYNSENGIPYAIDSSNLEDKFLRNKIRHNLIQKMSKTEKNSVISEIEEKNIILKNRHNEIRNNVSKNIDDLLSYSDEDLAYHFTILCRKIIKDYELSLRQVKEFRKIMISEKPNVCLRLKNGLFLAKTYKNIDVKFIEKEVNFSYKIDSPCVFDCEYFFLDFTKESLNRNVKESDYPLIIRNANKTDKMTIKNYEVSMRRQFINWKMPLELRNRWPIIVNNDSKIVYVPKYESNFKPDKDTNFFVKI